MGIVKLILSSTFAIIFFSIAVKFRRGFSSGIGALSGAFSQGVTTLDTLGANQGHH